MVFEPCLENAMPEGLELLHALLDVPHSVSKMVPVPVYNGTQNDIYLPQQTVLGTLEPVAKSKPAAVQPMSHSAASERLVNSLYSANTKRVPKNNSNKWHPPVDLVNFLHVFPAMMSHLPHHGRK